VFPCFPFASFTRLAWSSHYGKPAFPESLNSCRAQNKGLSAKNWFAESTSRQSKTLGKG